LTRPEELPSVELLARLPRGFRAGAVAAGIKASGKPDLAVVLNDGPDAAVAGTFTTNRVAAAPVILSRRHLAAMAARPSGLMRAVISTSGCANAATGEAGMADQERLAAELGNLVGARPEHTLATCTGLIGTRLPMERILPALETLVAAGLAGRDEAFAAVAEALRTTDSRAKAATARVRLPGSDDGVEVDVTVSGVAKGVGMIHPRMATMLALVLTDATADMQALSAMLRPIVARTWNQISVDGDTSTNDTVFLVASGSQKARPASPGSVEFRALSGAVEAVARSLARQQAADGEGATTLISCQVGGARDDADARAVARAVVGSSLVKAAVHGRDPNWGRVAGAVGNAHLPDAVVLAAAGLTAVQARRRAGAPVEIDVGRMRIALCGTSVYAGAPVPFDRAAVRATMDAREVLVEVDLGSGDGWGEAWGCDLTEAYVVENSEYST
jgi:glutamate N-acetyltransferase / amino-acid N-acetyltransferase